ncbi:MAG: type II secretion system F family protein [Candidatus Omnitrophica bacterium]|nr:type II secretion system F family protein [Candidatus Omnitrophota bacterium]
MPLFYYIAKGKDGKTVKNVEDASSRDEIVSKLKGNGMFIISIREAEQKERGGGRLKIGRGKRKHSGINTLDVAFFARNLATTLSAGVPLLRSLEIMAAQTESKDLSKILSEIVLGIKKGLSLSESIAQYPAIFSPLWRGIIEVGETSGNLPFVLDKLSDYLELRVEFERKMKSAMIYPIILMCVAFGAVLLFFKVILPKFTTLFDQFNIALPLPTQILFNLSKFVDAYFFVLLFTMLILGGVGWYALKKPATKKYLDRLVLTLPLIRDGALYSYLERFSSTMYILLESGVPIVYTLEVVSKSIGNSLIEHEMLQIKENVRRGKSLSSELEKLDLFPPLVTEVAHIGEEAGNLPEMFKKISTHYQKQLTTIIERLVAAFEPLMIVMMGIVIGSIVISLFLPMFKIATLGGA